MAAFVNDNEIKSETDANACPVALQITVSKMVSVRHRTLVLHTGIRHLDQFVAVFLEGIFAKVVLESLKHATLLWRISLQERRLQIDPSAVFRYGAPKCGDVRKPFC